MRLDKISRLWIKLESLFTSNVVATTSQKTNSNTSNKSQGGYQVRITRELNKESLLYSSTIYTKFS